MAAVHTEGGLFAVAALAQDRSRIEEVGAARKGLAVKRRSFAPLQAQN